MVQDLAIAAPHALATRAGRRVADQGGSVVDVVVAAAAALTVVYPHQCSLGGDLFALLRLPDGTVRSINSSGAYGSGPVPSLERMPVTGPFTVTVPGAVAGWQTLLDLGGGNASLPDVLAPAVELAEDGAPVGDRLAKAMAAAPEVLGRGEDRTLQQPELAATLRELGTRGLADFYRGSVGDRVAAAFGRLGIPVTRADLAAHRVEVEDPLAATAAGCRVLTSPPNSQGYLLLTTLLALDEHARRGLPVDDRTLVDLFAFTAHRRERELADPRAMTVAVGDLLAHEAIARDVDGLPGTSACAPGVATDGDTVAVTAVAADGTAVSLIQSLFSSFGSRLRDPETGIVFHNRGSFFSADPASPNVVAPGKRPAHTLMPVLAELPNGTVAALGAMGGRAQPQIHTQLLQQLLAGADPAAAVAAPRFLVRRLPGSAADSVLAESDLDPARLAAIRRSGLDVQVTSPHDEGLGHAMVCVRGADGRLAAGADPRSDGDRFVSGGGL